MTAPRQPQWVDVVVRVLAGIVSAAAGALWGLGAFAVVTSRLANDPHGYGLIFGFLLAFAFGLVLAVALPFTFPRGHRWRVSRIAMAAYVASTALLLVVWFSAS